MKRIVLFVMIIGWSFCTLYAESGTCGENLTWDLTDGVLTISGTGEMENYELGTYVPWSTWSSVIISVIISNGVTSIGSFAFVSCAMTSVTIGNSVTSIGYDAFRNCYNLTNITIPNGVKSIGIGTFRGCTSLESVDIPNSVTNIGDQAFWICKALTSVTIPNSVTSIGEGTFWQCTGLTSVTIGNGVKSIGSSAFQDCYSLTSVTIPNSVTSIGGEAFSGCSGLTSVTIPNSVTSIGNGAFYGCADLTSASIGNSVTSIGDTAFTNCKKLDTVYCYAETPPTLVHYSLAFYDIKNTAILYVPDESVDGYQSIEGYAKSFADIRGMGNSFVDSITTTSVRIRWERDSLVATYHICIFDDNKDTVAVYTVDSAGNVLDSKQYMPSVLHNLHYKEESTTESDLLTLTVKDLKPNSAYTYTIDGETKEGKPVEDYHAEGSFHTKDPNGIIDVFIDDPDRSTQKILINGQIYILRGNKIFDLRGQEVR